MSDELQTLEAFLQRLADASRAAIRPYFRSDLAIDDKQTHGAFDPVTEGDRAGERAIRDLIDAEYPDHGILGEEYGEKKGTSPYTWIIDPIDGTRAFMCGHPLWGTLIGLLKDGVPVAGLMDQPYTRERFTGGPSGATFTSPDETAPMKTRACASLADAVLCATDPRMFPAPLDTAFNELGAKVRLLRWGGDCYNYSLVAHGHIDLVVEAGNQPYDILPLVPVIEAAGGIVTDWEGRPLRGGEDFARCRNRMIAAGDRRAHEQAIEILSKAP